MNVLSAVCTSKHGTWNRIYTEKLFLRSVRWVCNNKNAIGWWNCTKKVLDRANERTRKRQTLTVTHTQVTNNMCTQKAWGENKLSTNNRMNTATRKRLRQSRCRRRNSRTRQIENEKYRQKIIKWRKTVVGHYSSWWHITVELHIATKNIYTNRQCKSSIKPCFREVLNQAYQKSREKN